MRKFSKKQRYVAAGIFALVAAFPLVTSGVPSVPLHGSATYVPQEAAADNRDNYRQERRDYARAIELCQRLIAGGKDVACPDVNDKAGIAYFLKNHENMPSTGSGSTGTTILNLSDLKIHDLNLMRWYQRINTCPETMKDYMPGFYELCQSLLNPTPMLLQGFSPLMHGAAPDVSLGDYIKANRR